MEHNKRRVAYVYLIPLIGVFLVNVFYPIVFNFALSFYDWSGFSKHIFTKFIGFANYIDMFKNEYFWVSLRNMAYFELASCIFQVLVPLFFAVILFYGYFKYENVIKGIIYFPALISPVVVGLVWRYFFSLQGPINIILKGLGLNFLAIEWLGNIYTPIWIIAFINTWQWTGFGIVLYYAGLASIDKELIESAMVDGASFSQYIRKIVIPLLKPIILLDLLLVFITGFRVFDIIYVVTRGGPVHQSEVLTTLQYYYSYDATGPNKMGMASVISIVLLVLVVIFSLIRIFVRRRSEFSMEVRGV
ncbi:MAG: sugar ABC transporter permease [Actinobacteria bacterium]|nr:sugar ABC transporter permease [Actinomycetota bacterium]